MAFDHTLRGEEIFNLVSELQNIAIFLFFFRGVVDETGGCVTEGNEASAPSTSLGAWHQSPSTRDGDEHRLSKSLGHWAAHHISKERKARRRKREGKKEKRDRRIEKKGS